jgi:hypothetical protein
LAQYSRRGGSCNPSVGLDLFIREVFEYLLFSGSGQNTKKFIFTAQNGIFTVPYEVESIQKVKINNHVGMAADSWFEFRSSSDWTGDCLPASDAVFQETGYYSTAYDLNCTSALIGTLGVCDESPDAHIIVQGKDSSGREIFTVHQGKQICGEYLSIRKGMRVFSQVNFAQITGVTKTKTNGYVQLLTNRGQFLSDYSPLEEVPAYRRYKLTTDDCVGCKQVSVLARIRLKEAYADNDRIPFETLLTLRLAGQRVNAEYNNDSPTAAAKDAAMNTMIEREAAHKRVSNGSPIEFFYGTSAGRIRNIIGTGWRRIGFRRGTT